MIWFVLAATIMWGGGWMVKMYRVTHPSKVLLSPNDYLVFGLIQLGLAAWGVFLLWNTWFINA